MSEDEPSYIDYETFLDPTFSPTQFANTLVLSTNDSSDSTLDLATPLQRVLFDKQEIDTHIHNLTTKHALPLLEYTKDHARSSQNILQEVEGQVASLTEAYKSLEKEVIERYEAAEQVRVTAECLVEAVRVGRAVSRSLMLGRQLEVQVAELQSTGTTKRREDHRAMVRSANTLLSLRQIFQATGPGEEADGLQRVNVVVTLRSELVLPTENKIITKAQQIMREFSMSSLVASNIATNTTNTATANSTFAQTEDTKSRTTSALQTLYLLSPLKSATTLDSFDPELLLAALEEYIQTALKSSLASLARALATLPTLDRTLLEVSARCQNIVALSSLLSSIKPLPHPLLSTETPAAATINKATTNFLQPLLIRLDTSSLPSYFWRSLASSLSLRVQEIVQKGGVSARTLRSNKESVKDSLRQCVNRGSQLPASTLSKNKTGAIGEGGWEREAAVMVAAITGALGR